MDAEAQRVLAALYIDPPRAVEAIVSPEVMYSCRRCDEVWRYYDKGSRIARLKILKSW